MRGCDERRECLTRSILSLNLGFNPNTSPKLLTSCNRNNRVNRPSIRRKLTCSWRFHPHLYFPAILNRKLVRLWLRIDQYFFGFNRGKRSNSSFCTKRNFKRIIPTIKDEKSEFMNFSTLHLNHCL